MKILKDNTFIFRKKKFSVDYATVCYLNDRITCVDQLNELFILRSINSYYIENWLFIIDYRNKTAENISEKEALKLIKKYLKERSNKFWDKLAKLNLCNFYVGGLLEKKEDLNNV